MSEWIKHAGGGRPDGVSEDAVVMACGKGGTPVGPMAAKNLWWENVYSYKLEDARAGMVNVSVQTLENGDFQVGDSHEALTFHTLPVKDTMQQAAAGVGDINSSAKGSGARYNNGKTPVELIPLKQIGTVYLFNDGLDQAQRDAARCLQFIGEFQARTRGVEALYDALLALGDTEEVWRECAQVFDYGRRKYAEWNWSRGMAWSIPLGCAGRHAIWGILAGEHLDAESGLPHRGHIACNIVMLIAYVDCYQDGDDRPPADQIGLSAAANDADASAVA